MEDLSRLSRMLQRIQAVLHDAEEREIYDKNIQIWLSELREVAYDAEDVLDQYDYQVIKTQLEGITATVEAKPSLMRERVDDDNIYGYQVALPTSNSIKIPISCDMAMRIIEIIMKFNEISHDRKALYLREEDAPRRPHFNDVMKRPPSSSLVLESDVFGREEEKRKIIQLLMSHSEMDNIVIPIVGMGGVGKTTLAQLVYNDPEVCQHFSPKVWVCVSEQFDVLRITKEIMSSIVDSSKYNDNNNLNYLQCKLKDALLNKKFLIILDDVWNERADIWEALQAPFSGTGVGKIIITTRSMSVAHIMQTVYPLQLECLDEEKSWLLFQRHAFHGWKLDQQLYFEQLGRRITKKCGGLPLALKVIGGYLRNEFKEKTWKDVLNNNLWDPKEIILSTLRISYNHLPTYLKPCFLYASLFPKDHYFKKLELIRMWIDQGYIQLTERKSLWEDIADEYFEDLVRRSFFQCSKHTNKFTLHDMVHALAQSITRSEICSSFDFDELKNIPKNAKHIFIKDAKVDQVLPIGNIRTLYIHELDLFSAVVLHQNSSSKIVFSHLGCLRVLRFHARSFECTSECIDTIGYLEQLRYLSIHVRVIHMKENSLCSLYKLQTLRIISSKINMLPHAMGKLINLRHLMISASYNQALVPKSYFGSKNLLSFRFNEARNELFASVYHVRRDGPYSSIRWLKPLTNLRRSLKIYGLENVVDHEDAMNANLQSKPYVERLTLIWNCGKYDECARNDKAILEGLKPHTNLKKLSIYGYNNSSFPSWFGNPHYSSLTKILLISFYSNEECKFLPLSKLPSLTSLKIIHNNGIIRMGQDFWFYNAPHDYLENYSIEEPVDFLSFQYLTNKSLLEWKERPMERNGDFPSLKCLHVIYCCKLQQISTLPLSLEIIYVQSCERLEYIALPYSSGHLSRLQKVKILDCDNLKSVINLNNLLGTLKVLKLGDCYRLKPDPDKDFDHSFGRVSFEEGFALVFECPGMREWCKWHSVSYEDMTPVSASGLCRNRGVVKKEERFSAGVRAVLCRRKSGSVLCRRKSGSLPSPRSGKMASSSKRSKISKGSSRNENFLSKDNETAYGRYSASKITPSRILIQSDIDFQILPLFSSTQLSFILTLTHSYHKEIFLQFLSNLRVIPDFIRMSSFVMQQKVIIDKEDLGTFLHLRTEGDRLHTLIQESDISWSLVNDTLRGNKDKSHQPRVYTLLQNARIIQHVLRSSIIPKAGDRVNMTPLLSLVTYLILSDKPFDEAQLILDYIHSLFDIRHPQTKRKKNIALGHLICYILEKKYNLIYPEPPTKEPIFFTNASFRSLMIQPLRERTQREKRKCLQNLHLFQTKMPIKI
ncbi:hypothetical protein M5K25_018781 [Dendrobium thyrsiflorum]|uniref:Uncharacterized protein n=1 Tax=Dendrobium thyrsiflorum TaxID=117978 RepID=A0ABD0UDX6_DENTH